MKTSLAVLMVLGGGLVFTPEITDSKGIPLSEALSQADTVRNLQNLCGPLSLCRSLAILGQEVGFEVLADEFQTKTESGVMIAELISVAKKYNSYAELVKLPEKDLSRLPISSILFLSGGRHCVVFEGIDRQRSEVRVWDSAAMNTRIIKADAIRRSWTGDVILLEPALPSGGQQAFLFILTAVNVLMLIGVVLLAVRRRLPNAQSADNHQ